MISQGQVGPLAISASLAPGSQNALRMGNMGEQLVSELHGHYYESAYRGSLYTVAATAQTTTAGTATTYVGLCLANPIGATVNLSIMRVGWTFTVVFANVSILGLMKGYSTSANVTLTVPITPSGAFRSSTGQAVAASSATLPVAPTVTTIIGAGLTGAVTTAPSTGPTIYELDGSILLPPGGYLCFYTSAVSAASSFSGSFLYAEVPV